MHGDRLLDRESRQLMGERHRPRPGDNDARADAFLQTLRAVARKRVEQPQLRLATRHRDGVQQHPRPGTELRDATEHRVADGGGDLLARRRQRLGDEEGVSGRLGVELVPLRAVWRRELSDGVARERRKPEPVDRGKRCDLSEHGPQRMPAIQPIVPIRCDHHRRQAVRAPSEEPHDIERRLVRSVDVLEHENRRRALLEHTPNRRGDLVGNGAAFDGVRHVAARRLRNIDERPERTRREQHVARSPQNASRAVSVIAEFPNQGRLADAGLAGHQHHPTGAAIDHVRETSRQRGELLGPLQQPARVRDGFRPALDSPTLPLPRWRDYPPLAPPDRCSAVRLRFSSHARSDASSAPWRVSTCASTGSPSHDSAVRTSTPSP